MRCQNSRTGSHQILRDGMVSVDGSFYSVPDATRHRLVDEHTLVAKIRIFEDDVPIALHRVWSRPSMWWNLRCRLRLPQSGCHGGYMGWNVVDQWRCEYSSLASSNTAPISRVMAPSFGNMPTTSARRLTSLFKRSSGLVL